MSDEQGVTPAVESVQAGSVVEDTQVTESSDMSAFDSLIGEVEETTDSSPESTNETAETSTSEEKTEGDNSSPSDVNTGKVPEAIPYSRFTEVNEKYKEAEAKAKQYEEFMNNPEMVRKYLEENFKTPVQQAESAVDSPKTLEEINAAIENIDFLDDDANKQFAALNRQKDELYRSMISTTLNKERQVSEFQTEQELIKGELFKGQPDLRVKAEQFVDNWIKQNPKGAQFPGNTSEEKWALVKTLVGGTTPNSIEQGRQEAIASLNTKKVLDTSTNSEAPTGDSGYNPFATLY